MRRVLACLLVVAWVLTATTPAFAARGGMTSSDRRISVSGDVEVARGEVVTGPVATIDGDAVIRGTVTDYVVVGDGDLYVSGRVTRGVVVVHGNARITGTVEGDVVALTGRVTVTHTGRVEGDVVSRRDPSIARGTVEGDVRSVDLRGIFTGIIIGFLAYLWLAVSISIAVVGLVFVGLLPKAADTAVAAGKRVKASIGWGLLIGVVGPFLGVLIVATVLGLPLGLTMLAGLNVLAPLGYVTVALMLGRVWVKGETSRGRLGAFFAGFGVLRLVALIPGVGLVVWVLVCIYGIGAVSMAAWYGGHDSRAHAEPDELPPPPPPPPPPAPVGSPPTGP
jgi:cytoskeletal protein CcmA (bactofilin family)